MKLRAGLGIAGAVAAIAAFVGCSSSDEIASGGAGASASTTMSTSATMSTTSTSTSTSGGGSGGGVPQGACGEAVASDPEIQQALPMTYLDTTYVAPKGSTIDVPANGDLQGAIDNAKPGDVITLAAGATYPGPITLKAKTGSDWIIIRTNTADGALPSPGTRVTPGDAAKLAKITAPNTQSAIVTEAGAHHYRLIGLEVAPVDDNAQIYELVALGDSQQTTLDNVAHDLILDRMFIHGTATSYTKRGVQLDSASTSIIDSWVSDCHAVGQDAQAVAGFNGPGPYKLENNHLEGSGENVIFGGADPKVPNLVPSDIEITRNHFFKPFSWRVGDPSFQGMHWSVKNVLELKNARRVLVRCNVFENNWADAQVGFAIVFTPRNQDGTAPWCTVEDVTFVKNIVEHTASGVNILGTDDLNPSGTLQRVLVQDSLFLDVSDTYGGSGWLYQMLSGATKVKIDHTTGFQTSSLVVADGPPSPDFIFSNNIEPHNLYGVFGSGQSPGNKSIAAFFPNSKWIDNVIVGADANNYPANNFYPAMMSDVGFVDLMGGDYHLAASSMFKNKGSDGRDLGADIDAIDKGTQGVAK